MAPGQSCGCAYNHPHGHGHSGYSPWGFVYRAHVPTPVLELSIGWSRTVVTWYAQWYQLVAATSSIRVFCQRFCTVNKTVAQKSYTAQWTTKLCWICHPLQIVHFQCRSYFSRCQQCTQPKVSVIFNRRLILCNVK